ncbi:GDSL-type esterase/lipase family protein [Anaerolentibacter hominis]|uniref:GDSL-type esterase/lipase family protein n=1 Tax=Anaerolentibacter hominis TaxID=3079009 RepID=UPI0031B8100A
MYVEAEREKRIRGYKRRRRRRKLIKVTLGCMTFGLVVALGVLSAVNGHSGSTEKMAHAGEVAESEMKTLSLQDKIRQLEATFSGSAGRPETDERAVVTASASKDKKKSDKKKKASDSKKTPTVSEMVKAFSREKVAFVGDSRTNSLYVNTGFSTADFFTANGLNVDSAVNKDVIKLKNGKKGTVIKALDQGTKYDRIYIMLGVNELGWPYGDIFEERYEKLINKIKKVQPDAAIYIQSILPVTKSRSDEDKTYNNKNVKKFNGYVKEVAENTDSIYLNVGKSVSNRSGALPEGAASDGIHLNKEYSEKWLKFLYNDFISKE